MSAAWKYCGISPQAVAQPNLRIRGLRRPSHIGRQGAAPEHRPALGHHLLVHFVKALRVARHQKPQNPRIGKGLHPLCVGGQRLQPKGFFAFSRAGQHDHGARLAQA
jgi:hypothetical protein